MGFNIRTRSQIMPSKTKKQAKTMRAAAHNPEFAKKMGIPQSVAKEFAAADKAKTTRKPTKGKKKAKKGR
jgi:hypothetical protein